jgi:hypothetical protein
MANRKTLYMLYWLWFEGVNSKNNWVGKTCAGQTSKLMYNSYEITQLDKRFVRLCCLTNCSSACESIPSSEAVRLDGIDWRRFRSWNSRGEQDILNWSISNQKACCTWKFNLKRITCKYYLFRMPRRHIQVGNSVLPCIFEWIRCVDQVIAILVGQSKVRLVGN